jgi:hypothetical protein
MMHIILDETNLIWWTKKIHRMGIEVDIQLLCTSPIQEVLTLLF